MLLKTCASVKHVRQREADSRKACAMRSVTTCRERGKGQEYFHENRRLSTHFHLEILAADVAKMNYIKSIDGRLKPNHSEAHPCCCLKKNTLTCQVFAFGVIAKLS